MTADQGDDGDDADDRGASAPTEGGDSPHDSDRLSDGTATDGDGSEPATDGDGSEPATDESTGGDVTDGVDAERVEELAADVDILREKVADLDREHADRDDLEELRADLTDLQERVDERTVHREDLRSELRRYVRKRQRRGHATGWGPYLVLLYGTVMTVAAFYYLGDWPAMFAMFVIWLSTLGMYVFMLVVGTVLGAGRRVAGLRDLIGKFRG